MSSGRARPARPNRVRIYWTETAGRIITPGASEWAETRGSGRYRPTIAARTGRPRSVSFARDVQPIPERGCRSCHGDAAQLSTFDRRTRESALQGGACGSDIVPGGRV